MEQESGEVITPAHALQAVRLGAGLGEATREKLARVGQILVRGAGAVLFREGEKTPYLGVVISGRVGIRTYVAGRGDVTLSTVEAGDIFGWSVLVPPSRAHATVWAVTDVTVLGFPAESLRRVLAADPDLAAAVYQHALSALGRRITSTRLQMLDLFGSPRTTEPVRPPGALSRRLADVRRGAATEEPTS
ncbi:MAG: cyclic nucleotide-binding domain-containing protein [Acidimicrobiia bacterium]|nr:cyclic nucleotide-binding domain-containing protein [Acidimicrobiia bacterium]